MATAMAAAYAAAVVVAKAMAEGNGCNKGNGGSDGGGESNGHDHPECIPSRQKCVYSSTTSSQNCRPSNLCIRFYVGTRHTLIPMSTFFRQPVLADKLEICHHKPMTSKS